MSDRNTVSPAPDGAGGDVRDLPSRAQLRRGRRPRSVAVRVLTWTGSIAAVLVLALLAFIAYEYVNLDRGLNRSDVLEQVRGGEPTDSAPATEVNMLVMGLDSRLDLQGKPLPRELYQLMHTGNETIGGMNTNVLMYIHIPADGKPATVLQIPRDNYVAYAGCPGGRCEGKIKEAYARAFDDKIGALQQTTGLSDEKKHAQARDAGRLEEIKTIEKFLGNGIRINQWVEVTMVAFYQLAQAVEPITVCLKKATKDTYSGADFKAGRQQISAEQAMAFVRQRRDVDESRDFSDLDRERRQQAFIASLAYQLKQKGTFADPRRINDLIGVAKRNVATDTQFSILDFARDTRQLTDGEVTYYTLPIQGYFTDVHGGMSNKVDVPQIQATVKKLLASGTAESPKPTTTTSSGPKPTLSVVNASGLNGVAGQVLAGLKAAGYLKGEVGTAPAVRATSVVEFPAGAGGAAAELAALLGSAVTTQEVSSVPSGSLRIVLGSDFQMPPGLPGTGTGTGTPQPGGSSTSKPTATPLAPSSVGASGKEEDTSIGTLTALSGGGVPCVK